MRADNHVEKEEELDTDWKRFWNWLWNSDSVLSYVVFIFLIFIFVKFIFLPGLGFMFGTGLPLAIVESSSMDHNAIPIEGIAQNNICGKIFEKTHFFDKEEYWKTCGDWYEENTNITEQEFYNFKLSAGFRKGDLIIIFGKKDIKLGDVIIFNAGRDYPIIHRVISLNPIQTKGDHNPSQLAEEKNISADQIIGVAVGKVPYVGWIKLGFVELIRKIVG